MLTSLGATLVPFFDLINHRAGAPAIADAIKTSGGDRFTYVAGKTANGGEELVHDYSSRSQGALDWLLRYGFVPDHIRSDALLGDRAAYGGSAELSFRGVVYRLPDHRNALLAIGTAQGPPAGRGEESASEPASRRPKGRRDASSSTRPASVGNACEFETKSDYGDTVLALWPPDGRYYRATVGQVAADGTLELFFEDGDYRSGAPLEDIRHVDGRAPFEVVQNG